MPILVEIEKEIWLPDTIQTGNAFLALVARAQTDLEIAVCRSFEVREYTSVEGLLDCGTKAYLSMWPLVDLIKVEARRATSRQDSWGRTSAACDWTEIPATDYKLGDHQEICIPADGHYAELRATYTAGWDFSVTDPLPDPYFPLADPDVQAIKALVSEVVSYRESPQYCGITRDNDVQFQSSGTTPGVLPERLLDKARKYRAYHK